jgi:outer membrane protein
VLPFLPSNAQSKVDIKRVRVYAFRHNISIKQTELDIKTSTIEKEEQLGSFFLH